MKKFSGLKLGLGVVVASFLVLPTFNASAADGAESIKIDGKDILAGETVEGVSYDTANKTVSFSGFKGAGVVLIDNIDTILYSDVAATTNLTSVSINNANLSLSGALTFSGNITLKDTSSTTAQNVITILDGSVINAKGITAQYSYATTTKGIVLGKNICASDGASIINSSRTGAVKTASFFSTDGSTQSTKAIKLSKDNCSTDANPESPNTLDAAYIYFAVLAVSSAALLYRRRLAKR